MQKNSIVAKGLILLLIFSLFSGFKISNVAGLGDWVIDGDKIFIDDQYVYLSCQPHTIQQDTDVVFELISKQWGGEIDVAFGINSTLMYPKNPMIWNGATWVTLNKEIQTVNYDYLGFNKWYLLKNVNINQDVLYRLKLSIDIVFGTSGKYFFGVKRSSDTINQGYYIDPWWNSSWSNYQALTIDSDYIDVGLGGFPVLVVVPTSVGSQCQANGEDIRFLGMDNTTEFDYEIESWNGAGNSFVWVNITETIPSGSNYAFLCYYNNSGATDNQNPTVVWDADYIAVYHDSSWSDSTSNYYNLTVSGTPTSATGQIGDCMNFDGSGDGDYVYNNSFYDVSTGANTYTIECWMDVDASGVADRYAGVMIAPEAATGNGMLLYPLNMPDNFQSVINDDVGESVMTSTTTGQLNQWYYLANKFNSVSGSLRINTTEESTYSGQSHDFTDLTETVLELGRNVINAPDDWLDGQLDEIRISSIERNNSWLNASFHNQNQSTHLGNFLTWGAVMTYAVSITNYSPTTGTENISNINTTLSVTVNHTLGKNMDVNWYSNSSGNWILFASNTTSGNETCNQIVTNFSANGTIYYWNVSVEEDTNITSSGIYWLRTWYVPLNPTNINTTYTSPSLNITWTTGIYADATVVVRNNASLPTSPTDGYEAYNGTLEYYNDSNVQNQTYFMLYSYNSTRNIYSSGASVDWGGLDIAVFNESDNSAISSWDLFVTNQSGSQTYEATGLTNRHVVGYDRLPLGTDIDVRVTATGYKTRSYYVDLSIGVYRVLNVYLPSENNSNLYVLIVNDEYDLPVEDARIEIKQYINETIGYTNVSILYTDATGIVNVYLVPAPIHKYKIIISKSGYVAEESDYAPDPDYYGIYYPKYFKIRAEEPEIITKTFGDICSFTGEWITTNNTLRIYFYDSEAGTTDVTFWIYESYNDTLILKETHTYGSVNTAIFYNTTALNTSRMHEIRLEMNHTTLGHVAYQTIWVMPLVPESEKISGDWIEQLFEGGFGEFEFGYVNFFLIFVPCILLIVLGGVLHHPGLGVIIAGGYVTLFNWRVLVSNAEVLVILITLFFMIGFIVLASKKGRGIIK